MVVRFANGNVTSLDYREKAPAGATSTMYLDSTGEVIAGLSELGHLSAGVPGTVAGLAEAHTRYGKLPWKELVQPAIDLALNGFTLTKDEADGLNSIQQNIKTHNTIL